MCLLFLSQNICKWNYTSSCWDKRPGYPTFLFFIYRIRHIFISILFQYFIYFFHYDFGIFNNLTILLLSSISEHIHLSCLIRTNILSFYSWTSIGLHIRLSKTTKHKQFDCVFKNSPTLQDLWVKWNYKMLCLPCKCSTCLKNTILFANNFVCKTIRWWRCVPSQGPLLLT